MHHVINFCVKKNQLFCFIWHNPRNFYLLYVSSIHKCIFVGYGTVNHREYLILEKKIRSPDLLMTSLNLHWAGISQCFPSFDIIWSVGMLGRGLLPQHFWGISYLLHDKKYPIIEHTGFFKILTAAISPINTWRILTKLHKEIPVLHAYFVWQSIEYRSRSSKTLKPLFEP